MTASGSHPRAPEIAVVVLNWNGGSETLACLDSLVLLEGSNHRVIVVDNGSDDGSAGEIRAGHPDVTVVETGRNLGFSGGSNVGIRRALHDGASFVWLLNNDTRVAPGALTAMMKVMRNCDRVGIVGSVVRPFARPDGVEAWGGGSVNARLGTTHRQVSPGTRRLDYIAGTSMLIRREVFADAGLLDEDFFFYLEDVDFCRRAAATGWELAVAPDATILHKGGAAANAGSPTRSDRADGLHVRSSGVFVGKHAGWLAPVAVPVRLAGIAARRAVRGEFGRIPRLGREFLRGTATGMRRRRSASSRSLS